MTKSKIITAILCFVASMNVLAWTDPIPKMPIGMNLSSTNYYSTSLVFTDVMTTSDFRLDWGDYTGVSVDENGYPTQIPYSGQGTKVIRFLINNYYIGRYVVLYDGEGTLQVNGITSSTVNGKLYINFTGTGGNIWIDMKASTLGNHIRNIHIVPDIYAYGGKYPTFCSDFLDGLRPFHALRFMDWLATNNSTNKNWTDRPTKTSASQSKKGICLEYCVELCNTLNVDGWFCIPHLASDDYIRKTAKLLKDSMHVNLKIYIEYSNEIWNWQFQQAGWVLNNAVQSTEPYVIDSLTSIGPVNTNHPEKDAFMMSRLFKLFNEEFPLPEDRSRIVKVAAVQHGWTDNTRRILLFLKNRGYHIMPDVISPGGYFNFLEADHNRWNNMSPSQITADTILNAVAKDYPLNEAKWTDETATFANQFGVGYVAYEGGQHMQPYLQGDYAYNPSVWATQVHPKMFDMYMTNYTKHCTPKVNCRLFMAFSYIGERASKYGSWGHLERYDQLNTDSIVNGVPKYNAILYANTPKADSLRSPVITFMAAESSQADVTIACATPGTTIYYSLDGKYPFTLKYSAPFRVPGNTIVHAIASKIGYTHSKVTTKSVIITGMMNRSYDPRLSFYPNPASDVVGFTDDHQNTAELTFNIYNMIGTLVRSAKLQQNQHQLNIEDLEDGIYVMEIKSDRWSEMGKVMVQR